LRTQRFGSFERAFLEPQLQAEAAPRSRRPACQRRIASSSSQGWRSSKRKEHELAVPLLVIALEGAFWHLASERGVIERNHHRRWVRKGTRHRIDAIDAVVKLPDLDLDPDLVGFITTLTYGGAGNDFRHGTATDG
jgi:hypothetical protein